MNVGFKKDAKGIFKTEYLVDFLARQGLKKEPILEIGSFKLP